jgi:hypothetical protein
MLLSLSRMTVKIEKCFSKKVSEKNLEEKN